jgi:hypothetical protein
MGFVKIADIRVDRDFEERLPPTGEGQLAALVVSIKEHGVLNDLLVTADGLLLDGHRRLKATLKAGLKEVPVKHLDVSGEGGWDGAMAVVFESNVRRRHLSEAERAVLGSSHLRIERAKAKERMVEGGRRGGQALGNRSPGLQGPDRATHHAAAAVGVSRKTIERVEAIKRANPALLRRVMDGAQSVASAYRELKMDALRRRAAEEEGEGELGPVERLEAAFGRYRAIYMDPPWDGPSGDAPGSLASLPIQQLAHRDGCHVWLWSPWPAIRKGAVHGIIDILAAPQGCRAPVGPRVEGERALVSKAHGGADPCLRAQLAALEARPGPPARGRAGARRREAGRLPQADRGGVAGPSA